MKKLKSKHGLTLMEALVAIIILVMLVVAIGTSMNSAISIYGDSRFESNSAALADIINTSLNDMLRYAENITAITLGREEATTHTYTFTNIEYGLQDVYFYIPAETTESEMKGILSVKSPLKSDNTAAFITPLVNSGVYSDMEISEFSIKYLDAGDTTKDENGIETTYGGCFYITYTIQSTIASDMSRTVETVVRLANPDDTITAA